MIIDSIKSDMKAAMIAKEKERLKTIRTILAAFKQYEVDQRKDVDDTVALTILDKMVKQRRDSIAQFEKADRQDLIEVEQFEIGIISQYLPQQLTEDEISTLVDEAVKAVGAEGIRDMGKVMGILKPKVQGRADMGVVGGLVKKHLS
ncbi:MAG TPA: GatB/YqeY domain-containing protein [Aeromonadales bacterium]|nr:GatB/YqeY domain-containing protein [Aeromonadales bacterium]